MKFSQKKHSIIQKLSSQNDQELIQLALDLLKEKQPTIAINREEYTIRVWRNLRTAVAVDFTRIVPQKTSESGLDDIVVNLVSRLILPFDEPF